MRLKGIIALAVALLFMSSLAVQAQETEQDIVNKYLQKMEKEHAKKLGWASFTFSFNRINRNNDYNSFATHVSSDLSGTDMTWLDNAKGLGAEFGVIFKNRFAWSLGGEYWLKFGQTMSGTYTYQPSLSTAVQVVDPSSEITVFGIYTGFQYYLLNPPDNERQLTSLALKAVTTVGYYGVSWDLWQQFENLNLSTSLPEGENMTFKGSAPGITIGLGADYPLNFHGMVFGAEVQYMYLNFKNVAWYNDQDQEIVASYTGDADGRVDLGLSGFRAKVELKRFFSL